MIVARSTADLAPAERAIAIGTFDGVHVGHRAVIRAAVESGLRSTVVTFDPHPRAVLGYEVLQLASLARRVELIRELGPDELLVVPFTLDLSRREPEDFVREVLDPLGVRVVFAGENFHFGKARRGNVELLAELGFDVRAVPLVQGVSSTRIRALLAEGDVGRAAALLGRPYDIEGRVVSGDQRGGTLGYPTANLAVEPGLLVPGYGIYAGETRGHRVAMSVGINPHYGGTERRIEAFLLDYSGDLYGQWIRIEFWEYLRGEQAFDSERSLIEQIGRDVNATRAARRPV